VSGFHGEQFALPSAVDALRRARTTARTGEAVRISGSDPLNLTGILVGTVRVPARPSSVVTLVDGVPIEGAGAAGDARS
jgi:ATP-dependent helicase Lhr and Lhr-like helicase